MAYSLPFSPRTRKSFCSSSRSRPTAPRRRFVCSSNEATPGHHVPLQGPNSIDGNTVLRSTLSSMFGYAVYCIQPSKFEAEYHDVLLLTCVVDWTSLAHGCGAWHTHGHPKSTSLRASHGKVPRGMVDGVCARLSSVLSDGHTACSGRARHQRATPIFRRLLTKISSLIYPC